MLSNKRLKLPRRVSDSCNAVCFGAAQLNLETLDAFRVSLERSDYHRKRKELGISLFALADHLAVRPDVVQGWESGTIPLTNLDKERLEMALAWLDANRPIQRTSELGDFLPLPRPNLWTRVGYGAKYGAALAGCIFIVAAMFQVASLLLGGNTWEGYGITVVQVIIVYLVGFVVGGILVALIFPISRFVLGSIFLGFVLMMPLYSGAAIAMDGYAAFVDTGWLTALWLSAIVGGLVGLILWPRIRKLLIFWGY